LRITSRRAASPPATQTPSGDPIPVLAYYYIWYDTTSWDRAKVDVPTLGDYSSDDISVMRKHIQEAKAAGINGFIVSWKSTDVLNRRLEKLAQVAQQESFKLVIIYQGLDFYRNPLPVSQVANDLDVFIQQFATLPAFQLYSKPLVIWSGTWKFSTQEIEQVATSRRNKLLLLASERTLAGYTRLANLVDGNAYYWSSVNPATYPGYQDKLSNMGQLVHDNKGIWIAPAAPGFDARLIGGTTIVDRDSGDTFRTEINTAMASSPDALGIISWNEFSENSYIEPSQKYGSQYLDILSQTLNTPGPKIIEFDSSIPDRTFNEIIPGSRLVALGGLAGLILVSLVIIIHRR
ncbi:MAG TPA: endo-1,3-alpha-glucanase family glycosylhydrolase, partial [Anaerolineales bacterium]